MESSQFMCSTSAFCCMYLYAPEYTLYITADDTTCGMAESQMLGKSLHRQGVALTLTLLLFWESIFCVGARNPPFCVRLVTAMPQWNLANSSCLHCASHLCLCPLSSLVQLYSVLLCDYAVCNCVWLCVTVFSIAVSQLGRGVTTELPMGDSHATPLLRLPM